MQISQHPIALEVYKITSKPMVFKVVPNHITIFISSDKDLKLVMGPREMPLPANSNYLFYDQNRKFELPFIAEKDTYMCALELSIDTLHHIISRGTDELDFSQAAIFEKEQYHYFSESSTTIRRCVHEILENQDNLLLREAKKYAILDDYFNGVKRQTAYQCPFLNQKENVNKVREAKEILIANLQQSPTLKELAKQVALNEYNLKTGFKEIYGSTVHGFVSDYKMSKARELITKREYQIAEIADQMGYTNVSHFISAFKKKYGVTPKKFEMSIG